VSHDQSKWRKLAEEAASEQDPEKLMALVEELNGALSQTGATGRHRRDSVST